MRWSVSARVRIAVKHRARVSYQNSLEWIKIVPSQFNRAQVSFLTADREASRSRRTSSFDSRDGTFKPKEH